MPLIRPIFATDADLGLTPKEASSSKSTSNGSSKRKANAINGTPSTSTSLPLSAAASSVPPIVQSSRTMKASLPIQRGAIEVVDAGSKLKRFDQDAKTLFEANQPKKKKEKKTATAANGNATSIPSAASVSNSFSSASSSSSAAKSASATPSEVDLSKAMDEVRQLGATALKKWERRELQAAEDAKVGKKSKGIHTPFKMYLGMQKKNEERAKRRREEMRAQGLPVANESTFTRAKRQRIEERESSQEPGGFTMKVGKSFKGGVLRLGGDEIRKVMGMGTRGRGSKRGRR